MRMIKWCVFLCFLAWIGSLLYTDASDRVKSAQAKAWYRNANVERLHSSREDRAREWREFKECVAAGDRPEDCIN